VHRQSGTPRNRIPPVELDDFGKAVVSQELSHAQPAKNARPVPLFQAFERGQVQMVVVIVREQDEIDLRQVVESNPGRPMAPRPDPGNGGDAFRPDRVGQDVPVRGCGTVA
jgi:hypothetical protein